MVLALQFHPETGCCAKGEGFTEQGYRSACHQPKQCHSGRRRVTFREGYCALPEANSTFCLWAASGTPMHRQMPAHRDQALGSTQRHIWLLAALYWCSCSSSKRHLLN